jgi:hypothetical protein
VLNGHSRSILEFSVFFLLSLHTFLILGFSLVPRLLQEVTLSHRSYSSSCCFVLDLFRQFAALLMTHGFKLFVGKLQA